MVTITIITPCSRPENLERMVQSIDFNYIDQWIIVYDQKKVENNVNKFRSHPYSAKIVEYIYTEENCSWGNGQRNYAMSKVENKNTFLYFLDDDNIIHPNLYTLLQDINDEPLLYTFMQDNYGTISTGDRLYISGIDTAMFLIHYDLCKTITWDVSKREADGLFFLECYHNNMNKHKYIEKVLCYYNYLHHYP